MRLVMYRPAGLARVLAILAVGMMVFSAGAAPAWSRYRDHIYADSFGNLVIHLAKELSSYEGASSDPDPDVVYLDDNQDGDRSSYRDCYRPPYVFKGRSYMYGLADGVVPQAPCR